MTERNEKMDSRLRGNDKRGNDKEGNDKKRGNEEFGNLLSS